MDAMDEYKRANGRMFPTCSEILEVVEKLGYTLLTPEEIASRQASQVEQLSVEATVTSAEQEAVPA